jgi:hypothetical protein
MGGLRRDAAGQHQAAGAEHGEHGEGEVGKSTHPVAFVRYRAR